MTIAFWVTRIPPPGVCSRCTPRCQQWHPTHGVLQLLPPDAQSFALVVSTIVIVGGVMPHNVSRAAGPEDRPRVVVRS